MIPILQADQMLAADQHTIRHEAITSIDLMERAARACVGWLLEHEQQLLGGAQVARYEVFCGPGNNGGDGLAIARMLYGVGRTVRVFVVGEGAVSHDREMNLQRLPPGLPTINVNAENGFAELIQSFEPGRIIVDALFGTGLNKPLQGSVHAAVDLMNYSKAPIVSVDLPSGLYADGRVADAAIAVRAAYTLTFQCPKPAFFYSECHDHVGDPVVLSLGMDPGFLHDLQGNVQLV